MFLIRENQSSKNLPFMKYCSENKDLKEFTGFSCKDYNTVLKCVKKSNFLLILSKLS